MSLALLSKKYNARQGLSKEINAKTTTISTNASKVLGRRIRQTDNTIKNLYHKDDSIYMNEKKYEFIRGADMIDERFGVLNNGSASNPNASTNTKNWQVRDYQTYSANRNVNFIGNDYIADDLVIREFKDVGTFSWTAPRFVTEVEYLVVGGGGGGGGAYDTGGAGGGGAGLVRTGKIFVTPYTNYTVVVGDGGDGGYYDISINQNNEKNVKAYEAINGENSIFSTIISQGGQGGLRDRSYIDNILGKGGSKQSGLISARGGGGGGNQGTSVSGNGGGGGGATSNGTDATSSNIGIGGSGITISITGEDVVYGIGGNGGDGSDGGNGGDGSSGIQNTGNGGNGASAITNTDFVGGKGGSGIVVLKYYQ